MLYSASCCALKLTKNNRLKLEMSYGEPKARRFKIRLILIFRLHTLTTTLMVNVWNCCSFFFFFFSPLENTSNIIHSSTIPLKSSLSILPLPGQIRRPRYLCCTDLKKIKNDSPKTFIFLSWPKCLQET